MNYPRMRNSNVLVRIERDRKTPGGILVVDGSIGGPTQAEVVSCGPGPLLDDGSRGNIGLSIGDRVLIHASGAELRWNGETLLIVAERDVLAVIPPTDMKMVA